MSAITWAEPVVIEPVDVLQFTRADAPEVSKKTQEVIVLSDASENLYPPSTSQVIRYLDSLDAGNTDCGQSLQVSTADVLRHAQLNNLADLPNTLPRSIDSGQLSSECAVAPCSSGAFPPPTSSTTAADVSPGHAVASGSPGSASLVPSASLSPEVVNNADLANVSQNSGGAAPLESVPTVSSSGAANAGGSSMTGGSGSGGVDIEACAPRRKRSEMGIEERNLMKQLGVEKQEKLMDAINNATTEYKAKLESIAKENSYKSARIKQLALHAPPIKSKELNEGHRKTLEEIQVALRQDVELLAVMKDEEEMKQYCEEYCNEKEAESKGKVQTMSGKSMAQVASKTLDLLQAQCNYAFLNSGTNLFGVTTHGSFEKDTAKGFFGAGPVDGFLCEMFGISLAKLGECFDAYVCTKEAMGKKKLSKADMAKATVKLINRCLEEITGVKDLVMAYSKYKKNIVAIYKVVIDGWPEDIPCVSPQLLTKVDNMKDLYEAWSEGHAAWRKLTSKEVRELKSPREPTGNCKQKRSQKVDNNEGDELQLSEDNEGSHARNKKLNVTAQKSHKRRRVEEENNGGANKKSARKGKGKDGSQEKTREKKKEVPVAAIPRVSKARKAKVNAAPISDGIADNNKGESNEYLEDE
ncbi:hypothetical protein BT96DRAFT_944436 [Gymnopus androsaceus JB14]|uniref:Uncharacterized protein n=1 Tax=Gymnopus androsaceus JB14 TaxID=1447944 RepID=A0A6A4H4J6_9AGAR|nr:hypothetical protein BT96DRAFT_944436 [Gymnopus androsaceus JB14]